MSQPTKNYPAQLSVVNMIIKKKYIDFLTLTDYIFKIKIHIDNSIFLNGINKDKHG
jgi:hypothetical protein